jgi:hypothetical protein
MIAVLFARKDSRYKEIGGGTMYTTLIVMLEILMPITQLLPTHLAGHGGC